MPPTFVDTPPERYQHQPPWSSHCTESLFQCNLRMIEDLEVTTLESRQKFKECNLAIQNQNLKVFKVLSLSSYLTIGFCFYYSGQGLEKSVT